MATENLALPLIEAGQAQKHVTLNEALRGIDAAAQLVVTSSSGSVPPSGAAEGERFIVAASPTGPWSGHGGEIAIRRGGGWAFMAPREGWLAFDREREGFLYRAAGGWRVGAGFMSEADKAKLDGVAASAAAQPLPRTIVVLGSSNAAGMGASTYAGDPAAETGWTSPPTSWAGLLAATLSGWTVINRSISGSATAHSIARFWSDCAPHRPSHVILATAFHNEFFDVRNFVRGTAELCRLCDLIGAIPVIRNASVANAMGTARYAAVRDANRQIEQMGRLTIDALSTLDDGSGGFAGGAVFHCGDGVHPSDAGYAALFSAIDPGMFAHASPGHAGPKPPGAWRINPGATAESAMTIDAGAGLVRPLSSFTMRARIGGVASGGATARAFLVAYLGSGAPLRLRNPSAVYEVAVGGAGLIASAVNPTASAAAHDCVMVYRHVDDLALFYIDGVLIGSAATGAASPVSSFCFGSRADASTGTAAVGYRFADCQLWSVPLSAEAIADMARTGAAPSAGLIFDGVMSGTPGGGIPNAVANGLMPALAASLWEPAATF